MLTGTLEKIDRNTATQKIYELGGECVSSVSKKTNYVIYGENAGSKLEKANNLGVKVINEQEFKDMIS